MDLLKKFRGRYRFRYCQRRRGGAKGTDWVACALIWELMGLARVSPREEDVSLGKGGLASW